MSSEEKQYRWWRDAIGGLWELMGKLQSDYLIKNGLKPNQFLLDVGCGSLRGGIYFIRYLQDGHYFGIDKNNEHLEGGKIEISENNLWSKNPTLVQISNFDFASLGQKFDYAVAQSLFTHIPADDIKICLVNMEKVLVSGGKFYATFFENPTNITEPISHSKIDGPNFLTFPDRDPYHYNFEVFRKMCTGTDLRVDYIGKWEHPRDQMIMVFTKS